jgi:hypothetical protein
VTNQDSVTDLTDVGAVPPGGAVFLVAGESVSVAGASISLARTGGPGALAPIWIEDARSRVGS